jgi:hypothetical protein
MARPKRKSAPNKGPKPRYRKGWEVKATGKRKPGFWYVFLDGKRHSLGIVEQNETGAGRAAAQEALERFLPQYEQGKRDASQRQREAQSELQDPRLGYLCQRKIDQFRKRVTIGDGSAGHLHNLEKYLFDFVTGYSARKGQDGQFVKGKYHHAGFGGLRFSQFKRSHIKKWLDAHPGWKSSGTKRKAVGVISEMFQLAVEDDLIPQNPATCYGISSTSREIMVWAPHQVDIARRYASPRFFDFFEAVLATGARPGEIAAFAPSQHYQELNAEPFAVLSSGEWKNGRKTGQRRYIPLPNWLAGRAWQHKTRCKAGPLFTTQKRNRWTYNSWSAAIKRMRERAERAGEPLPHVRFYDLRSTFITNALLDGFPIEWVAKAVGSSARVIEKHYWAYVEEGVKRMGEIVRRQDEKRNRPRIAKAFG